MDCCDSDQPDQFVSKTGLCSECGNAGSSVSIRTLFHQVRATELQRIIDQEYWFCSSDQCSVIYFGEDGIKFNEQDLRELTWVKNLAEKARTVCHCFGYTATDVLDPVSIKIGKVSESIHDYIRRGFCDCEIRNPSGKCCLSVIVSIEKGIPG